MSELPYLGKICRQAKTCPVYQGKIEVEDISTFLLKNVFCNRGYNGWKNCERFKLADEGIEIPATATPYNNKVETLS